MISKWLTITEAGKSESGKTLIWNITNGNVFLGTVKWFSKWRKYAFYPTADTIFEEECLRDLSFFCEQATRKHRKK